MPETRTTRSSAGSDPGSAAIQQCDKQWGRQSASTAKCLRMQLCRLLCEESVGFSLLLQPRCCDFGRLGLWIGLENTAMAGLLKACGLKFQSLGDDPVLNDKYSNCLRKAFCSVFCNSNAEYLIHPRRRDCTSGPLGIWIGPSAADLDRFTTLAAKCNTDFGSGGVDPGSFVVIRPPR